jgi:diaminopimelate epimerase
VKVTKMHALGNNYIYISEFEEPLHDEELPALARDISDVRKGVGSDGIILIGPSDKADVRMRIFNADGSEAENCGNGLRCVAKYAYDKHYVKHNVFTIEVKTGVVRAKVLEARGERVNRVTIDMGEARFGREAVRYQGPVSSSDADVVMEVDGVLYPATLVSMGNPHFVTFVDDAKQVDVARIGPVIECHPDFPDRINVEFVSVLNRGELDFRVWERGSGITYACGTGACASVAAGVRKGLLDNRVVVHLLGGDLEIEIRDGRVWMTGEAVTVLTGEYLWPRREN